MTNDRLAWHLKNWAEFMSRPSSKLGYPSKSQMISSGGSSSEDEFDIMCDEADTKCAQTMDAIIDSIHLRQRVAINHVWLKVIHHYETHEQDYDKALIEIERLAEKRGLM